MKLSQTGMGTVKLNNIDEMYPGQSILLQTGQLVQYGAGIFGYNTIPLLVKKKIESIIEETLNKYGCIEIDKQVIAQVVYRAAMESYGLVGFSQKIKGIVELLKEGNIAKGVKVVELEDNTIEIELSVIMQYGINIATVANNIIERVKYSVENDTAIKVSKIDVNVQGIRVK